MNCIREKIRKLLTSFFILLTVFVTFNPTPAHAQWSVLDPFNLAEKIGDRIDKITWRAIEDAAGAAWKNALRSFLTKLAYDTAVWIGSGDNNQKPLIFTQSYDVYLQEAGNAAVGEFLDEIAKETGLAKNGLCASALPALPQLKINSLFAKPNPKPNCSFSDIMKKFSDAADDYEQALRANAANLATDPQAVTNYNVALVEGNIGGATFLDAAGMAFGRKSASEDIAKLERKSGFKDKESKVSEDVKTPAEEIEAQSERSKDEASKGETSFTKSLAGDVITIFTSTLSAQLLKRLMAGLVPSQSGSSSGSSLAGSLSGDSSTTGVTGGITQAKELYAEFRTPAFSSSGTISILNDFGACPEQGAQVTNCVIDDQFRSAIEQGLSVKQAVDDGLLSRDIPFGFNSGGIVIDSPVKGISYRNIQILKQYSIVPVGWELAAEYMRDFGNVASLGTLMDAYTQCDTTNYSPFCGLVDPYWILKAPEVFCAAKGFGNDIVSSDFIDFDGDPSTPQQQNIVRTESCLNPQSCLSEDDSGACSAYGYCTEQRDIYRFQGDACPEYFASCQTYSNEETGDVSFLSNTLNFNDCNADNADCQWYCAQWNSVDSAFQCASQTEVYATCTNTNGCACTIDGESCTVANGGFQCVTGINTKCTLGTVAETDTGVDAALHFDRDVRECDSEDAGCAEFIPVKNGTNFFLNSSFEELNTHHDVSESGAEVDDDVSDTFGFDVAGNPCGGKSDTKPQNCYGWIFSGGDGFAVSDSIDGFVGLRMPQDSTGTGVVAQAIDTGWPLANRTFTLSFQYKNLTGNEDCNGQVWFAEGNGEKHTTDVKYGKADSFIPYVSEAFTYNALDTRGDPLTSPLLNVGLNFAKNCELVIDQVQVEEGENPSVYQPYGNIKLSINTALAPSCSVPDIGCELYQPNTGESSTVVPGLITNPNAEVCDDLTNPECSQCLEEFVGCDSYIEIPTPYVAPLNDESGFSGGVPPTEDVKLAIAHRKGLYCENDQTKACLASADCGGAACMNAISVVPEGGKSCSAASVGCEQYINLDQQTAGGEAVEHYTFIKQCVKETQGQLSRGELNTYYTFEGSDVSGYQLRSWYLKKGNADNGPCTHLDYYGATAETAEAACVDNVVGVESCTFGDDPDCQAFYNAQGEVFYRPKSATISVSDDCHPLRNALDNRIYYSIPKESSSCSAADNLCREYQGSEGGNIERIVDENFDNGVWYGGESSSTTVTAGDGQSMAIGSGTASASQHAEEGLEDAVESERTYVITFWAKSSDNARLLPYMMSSLDTSLTATSTSVDVRGSESYYEFEGSDIQLTNEWQRYVVGPLVYSGDVTGNEIIGFVYDGAIAYIDNVELQKSSSQYLVAGSAPLCLGYEGCEQYTDRLNATQYIKSFQRLCDANVAGCQALLQTENSDTPYPTSYNNGNEFSEDDIFIDADHPVSYSAKESRDNNHAASPTADEWAQYQTYVVRDEFLCNADVTGCQQFGQPDIDERSTTINGFAETFFVNDPDEYDTILCQEQQLSCQEYTASDGSITYFKDPGTRTCHYDSVQGKWVKEDGSDCSLQNTSSAAAPSQPAGPYCNGGLRAGELCSSDYDCPSGDETRYRCTTPEENEVSGTLTGELPGGVHVSIPYTTSERGWTGVCESQYEGCTQYFDPTSLNAEELVGNGSFEADVEDNNDATSVTPDEVPDDWSTALSNFYKPDGEPLDTACTATGNDPNGQAKRFADYAFDEKYSLVVNTCSFGFADFIPVDQAHFYTLSANVLPNVGYIHDGHNDTAFSIGLLYYDQNFREVSAGDDPEDYAIAAYEGKNKTTRDAEQFLEKQWHRYYAVLGPNLQHEVPSAAKYVRVFVEDASAHYVYFDNVSFRSNDMYTYIDTTVDGAAESDINSCNGEVNTEEGCVAFRDATKTNLTYLSTVQIEKSVNPDYTLSSCTFNSALSDQMCDTRMNVSDANTIIKVRRDRECAQWLACSSARNNIDENGNAVSSTCLDIGLCTKRNSETGVCIEWENKKNPQAIGYDDDVLMSIAPGDTTELALFGNMSGYATVGMAWLGLCDTVTSTCVGGQNAGASCSASTDCQSLIVQGHYQYHEAPQRGLGGAGTTREIIPRGDFEEVFCDGYSDYANVSQYDGISGVEKSRKETLACTLDAHCRTRDTDLAVQQIFKDNGINASVGNVSYEEGWCRNVDRSGIWNQWKTYGETNESKAMAFIADYDAGITYDIDNQQGTISAKSLDLNNVMSVTPAGNLYSGVRVGVGETLTPGQEYSVSFDAQYLSNPYPATDFIQVGVQHNNDADKIDFFESGEKTVDLVIALDTGYTGDNSYYEDVMKGLTGIIENLSEENAQFRVYIVPMFYDGSFGNAGGMVLDFDDYQTENDPGHKFYGNTNGITRAYSEDLNEVTDVLHWMVNNRTYTHALGYSTIQQTAMQKFTDGTDYNLMWRPGAMKVLLMFGAEASEKDPLVAGGSKSNQWDSTDEDNLMNSIGDPEFIFYGLIRQYGSGDCYDGNCVEAFDELADKTGGKLYGISPTTTTDLGQTVNDIKNEISKRLKTFQFDTTYQHYTLGPITIKTKDESSWSSELFIGQTRGSKNVPFVIDNVSLKPALELNKEGNPHSAIAANVVGRECRGYPESDARQCDYKDENGIFFQGWKGYCLEHDAVDSSKCLAWWPVDVIAGEKDQSHRAQSVYTNKTPAYYCLVAKGNSNLGVCVDDGTLCGDNDDCGNKGCLGNETDSYTDHEEIFRDDKKAIDHKITTEEYTVTHAVDVPFDSVDDLQTPASFVKLEPNVIEQQIHISEIDHLVFHQGTGEGDVFFDSEYSLPKIDTQVLEITEKDTPLMDWGYRRKLKDGDEDPLFGFNAGIWCGNLPCTAETLRESFDKDVSFVFAHAFNSEAKEGGPSEICGSSVSIADNVETDVNDDCKPFNPFVVGLGYDLSAKSDVWDCSGIDSNTTDSNGSVKCKDKRPIDLSNAQWTDSNTTLMRMHFVNGYLDAIYVGFYRNGETEENPSFIRDVSWTYYLKEPCLLAVEAVSQDAETIPWQTRVRNGSPYLLKDLKLSQSNLGGTSKMFGSMGNDVYGLTPDRIDGDQEEFSDTQFIDWTAAGPNDLPMQYLNNAVGSGIPYTCIGWCETTVCEANYDHDVIQYGKDSCPSNLWIGRGHGYCQDATTGDPLINDAGEVERCVQYAGNVVFGCSVTDAECADIGAGNGFDEDADNYEDQLNNAVKDGWDRLRLIFADIGDTVWYAPQDPDNKARFQPRLQAAPNTDFVGFDENSNDSFDFDDPTTLKECSGVRDGNDYCGIRPTIENMRVLDPSGQAHATTNVELENGESVQFTFDSVADADQEPVQTIRIAWEGEDVTQDFGNEYFLSDPWEAASKVGHTYSHVYTCDPTDSTVYNKDPNNDGDLSDGRCEYVLKVQIEDNWRFCSGATQTGVVRSTETACTSYDRFSAKIYVYPHN